MFTTGLQNRFVLLGTKTFAGADFSTSADRFWSVSSAGAITLAASETLATRIDARGYSSIVAYWTGTFANAVTMDVRLIGYPVSTGTDVNLGYTYARSGNSGGNMVVAVGGGQPYANNAGADFSSAISKRSAFPILMPYYVLATWNSGDTGVVTNGAVYIYGIR